jgi:hypothetical protein
MHHWDFWLKKHSYSACLSAKGPSEPGTRSDFFSDFIYFHWCMRCGCVSWIIHLVVLRRCWICAPSKRFSSRGIFALFPSNTQRRKYRWAMKYIYIFFAWKNVKAGFIFVLWAPGGGPRRTSYSSLLCTRFGKICFGERKICSFGADALRFANSSCACGWWSVFVRPIRNVGGTHSHMRCILVNKGFFFFSLSLSSQHTRASWSLLCAERMR